MDVQPNDFRYFLSLNNVRTEIVFTPSGWEKNSVVSFKRDLEYFGVIRTWGLPLDFVLDGAKILKRAYYQYGVEAGVRIEVEQLNRSTWVYEPAFVGDIDFSEFKVDGDIVSVTLMESGVTANIKAYDNVKYEYDLKGDDVVNVKLPGVKFSKAATSIFTPTAGTSNSGRFIAGTDIITNEMGSDSEFVTCQSAEKQNVNDGDFTTSPNWFARVNQLQAIRISGRMKGIGFAGIASPQGFDIQIRSSDNAVMATLYSSETSPSIIEFDFTFDLTLNPIPGRKMFIYCRYRSSGGFIGIEEGELNVSYDSVSAPSDCKGISAFNLFKRIVKRVSPGAIPESNLLSVDRKNLIFTSGDGIRAFEAPKLKISLKDFFKAINGIEDAAMGIENGLLRMEYSSYFARNIQIMDVGEVKLFRPRVAKEFMFNSIKIGYNDGNTDDLNGRLEYNSGQNWALPITRVQKVKDWVSPVRSDQYGIEKLRVEYNIKNTSKVTVDNKGDNDVFMLDCFLDADLYRPILGITYQSVTGAQDGDSAYNLDLTPKKNLLRHGAYLRGVMANMDASYINFGSGDKNTNLKTVKNSIGVKENENVLVASLPEKYFLPTIVNITCKLPRNAMKMFDNIPFGFVKFSYQGVGMKGYVIECNIDIAKNTEQEFQLLLTNDNNLLQLV